MQPTIRWMKPWQYQEDNETNDLEDMFEAFCLKWGVAWRREPRFFYQYDPDLPEGDSPRGYCPDYYLVKQRVYIEIWQGVKDDAHRGQISNP